MTAAHEGIDAGALAQLAREQPARFGLLYAFNQCPADYLHPSQRTRFAAGVGEAVWQDARSRRWLSEHILRETDLLERPCLDPGLRDCAVALLAPARLLRLARAVGAAIAGPKVRRSVARDEVRAWKERLTPELYGFAMTTASLLPQVPAAPATDDGAPAEGTGFGWIAAALAEAPDALRLRTALKLPADAAPAPVGAASARSFVHAVHAALEPQWCSTFATPAG